MQHKMEIWRACRAFGVDTLITAAPPGDEEGERHLSEYPLHFKCLWWMGRGQVCFEFGSVIRALASDAALALDLQPHIDVFVGNFVRVLGNDLSFSLILPLSVRFALDDVQHSAQNGLANTTNLVDCDWIQSNNGCVHGCVHAPSLSIGGSLQNILSRFTISQRDYSNKV